MSEIAENPTPTRTPLASTLRSGIASTLASGIALPLVSGLASGIASPLASTQGSGGAAGGSPIGYAWGVRVGVGSEQDKLPILLWLSHFGPLTPVTFLRQGEINWKKWVVGGV